MSIENRETILLVEDDLAIGDIIRKMLEELEYQVLVAGTPGEAIGIAETIAGDMQLLITDVVLPEMNGRKLFTRISVHKPGINLQ